MKEYKKKQQSYQTDLTSEQWKKIEPLFSNLREYKWLKRELVNATLYLVKTGCQWRLLPNDFPPYSTVHSFYRRARLSGLWNKILYHLVIKTREKANRKNKPSYAIIDSQSVKTCYNSQERGIDGGKKDEGSKATYSSRCNGQFVGDSCSCCKYS
jgi:transposase